jgi:aryl-alcohol dehydrogenase-like predicted oxidoreductase
LNQALATQTEIVVDQLAYSLVSRAIELKILPLCRDLGIGVIGYMPLWQGLLSDRYSSLDELSPWRRRTRHFNAARNDLSRHGEEGAEEETWQAVLAVREIARELDMKTAEVALRWVLAASGISCVLAGARNAMQLEANVEAVTQKLPTQVVQRLNQATDPLKDSLGPSCDYFENSGLDRTR